MPLGQKPLGLIHFWVIPFFPFSAPAPSFLPLSEDGMAFNAERISFSLQKEEMVYYGRLSKKVELFWNKISLTGCKWSILITPRSETPVSHSFLKSFLSQLLAPAPSFLPHCGGKKKWYIMGGCVKRWKCFGTKSV